MTTANWTTATVGLTLSNGARLVFTLQDGMLQGLTQVVIDDLPLIAPECSRLPVVETRDSWQVSGYRFTGVREEGSEVIVDAEVLGVKAGLGRKLDTFEVPYITTPRRTSVVMGAFHWHISPVTVTLGHPDVRQDRYRGFSYRYEFALDRAFHWVLDAGTWEVGGNPEGVTLVSQRMNPPAGSLVFTVSRQGRSFASGESFIPRSSNNATTVPDIPSDPTMGFILPIQAQLRGAGGSLVDVQYKDDGILLCYYEQADYYRSLIEWRTDDPGIGHLDHHYFPLTQAYTTPPKTIIATRVPGLTRAQALNRWTDAWEYVATAWRRQVGVSRQEPFIGLGLDCCGGAGKHYGSGPADLFERWEARFAWMQAQGLEYLFFGGIGNHRGNDLPMVANMCQPYDYTITERYGGPEHFRVFCERAHRHDVKIALWIGGHLSDHAPALREHPEWTINYDCGTPWDGGYRSMRACCYRRGFLEWMMAQMRDLKALGLDALFFDSYHNLAAMPIDYGDPTLTPQIKDLWAFQAACDEIGLPIMIESTGPIGVTSCGLWQQYLDYPELNYWSHYRCTIHDDRQGSDLRNGKITPEIFFRMLANKSPIGVSVLEQANTPFEGLPDIPEEITPMMLLYQRLYPRMQVRTIHEDGSIAWYDPASGERLLFVVGAGSVTVPEGYLAEPVFGDAPVLSSGTHLRPGLAAFLLRKVN
ncbi:MAG: hypothetical protein ACYC7E_10900 [Armatimonadota bacterium]